MAKMMRASMDRKIVHSRDPVYGGSSSNREALSRINRKVNSSFNGVNLPSSGLKFTGSVIPQMLDSKTIPSGTHNHNSIRMNDIKKFSAMEVPKPLVVVSPARVR
jgi:hypothetical protein